MTLLLPVDACPRCLASAVQVIVHPDRVLPAATSGIYADYKCPACHHEWFTGWAVETMNNPCPGCPACPNEKGRAA